MVDEQLDPGTAADQIWATALAFLRGDRRLNLTEREKGWLEGVVPEAAFGSTIILCVENTATADILQNKINPALQKALLLANEGKPMTPAFKIVPRTTQSKEPYPEAPLVNDTAAGDEAQIAEANTDVTSPYVPQPASLVPRGTQHATHSRAMTPSPMQGELPITPAPAQPAFTDQPLDQVSNKPNMDPETHLNKSATFDSFVPGPSNRFARTVALAVAEGTGREFNPLFIYGDSGLGKTHLLNAIGNYALQRAQKDGEKLSVRYVTSEEFTNEFIESIQSGTSNTQATSEFNRRYRSVDILLIDDIQFLSGKEQTLEQFFHTFNTLQQAGKRIVITSDVVPKNLKGFQARLISRFEQGLIVDIQPPDLETRIAILNRMANGNGMVIPNDVLELIAERFTSNIRELEGALTRVTAMSSLSHAPVTRALAEQTLQDFFTSDVEVRPIDIISQVAAYFHLTFDDIVGTSRARNIALARQIAMYLIRELTSKSLVEIGQVFGGKDHTTVMHACKVISSRMSDKQDIFTYVNELTTRIKQHAS